MNLRIGEGFVWIDGHKICEGNQELFGNRGMEIPEKQPICQTCYQRHDPIAPCCLQSKPLPSTEKQPACRHSLCQKCHQFHDPDLICHQPKENRTMGRYDIEMLLESLAKRFEAWNRDGSNFSLFAVSHELRAEKENWK